MLSGSAASWRFSQLQHGILRLRLSEWQLRHAVPSATEDCATL